MPSHVVELHDMLEMPNTDLQQCQVLCMNNQPRCRSIDYFSGTSLCRLNDVAYGDPGIDTLHELAGGDYYSFCERQERRILGEYWML